MSFIVLISRQCIIISWCLMPQFASYLEIHDLNHLFSIAWGLCTFRSLILFSWHPCGDNYFFLQKLFLTVFCHFILVTTLQQKTVFLIFYKSVFCSFCVGMGKIGAHKIGLECESGHSARLSWFVLHQYEYLANV